ncbi:FG-GAP-like repeat-containing protein [Streptomyces sp. PT12]|uniref:FG-GAP-like repeat-containing protein n=1 Tax=Streptomyces sp. PT12 TaxID=1510197 RepID=UPI000DE259F2|nr:FG-GAP-like repeat-containing protein [Streptomyces sp. PT12]RBM06444.1 hypothetical protein DEH69_26510 [Streptomyces sp. PT12]
MPVPTEELKLEIVNAATGKPLGGRSAPGAEASLVVRDIPDGGPGPEQWQLAPVPSAQGGDAAQEPAYVIRDAVSGQVLDDPGTGDRGVRRGAAAAGRKSQQWHVVPVEGEAGLYRIEGVTDGAVLGLGEPGTDETPVVLCEYDDDAESQRWRFVPAETERTSDPVLRWAPLSHWNGRQSWRLVNSPALRPVPEATPCFSDVLLVLDRFGSDQDAGGWIIDGANGSRGGQPTGWAGAGARFLADTTGTGRADIVAITTAKGAAAAASRGDGRFDDEQVLHPPMPAPSPADLWTVVDTTGDGRPDIVVLAADGARISARGEDGAFAPAGGEPNLKAFGHGDQAGGWQVDRHPRFLVDTTGSGRLDLVGCHDDGVWVSLQDEDGAFAPIAEEPVLRAFGHGDQAGGWQVDRHPRFLADTTGSGRLDLVGCHDDGVWVSLQDEDGAFAPIAEEPVLRAFGHGDQAGGWQVDRHPRFLADTTGSGRLDLVGCHDDGVWVSLQDEDGAFAEPLYVLDAFGVDQGWSSTGEHPRFLIRTTDSGAPDLVGFGPQGVVVARGRGDGTFEPAKLVLNDFGTAQRWTSEKHLRLLTDVTGDGTPDIVGFGDEGVWVAHSRGDGQFEQAQLVCRGFGYHEDAGGWRVDQHPRFLADITGDGRVDIVGFGGPGVHVARNLFRRFRTR